MTSGEVRCVRRRLAALDDALAVLEREWGETDGAGVASVFTDRVSVDATEFASEGGAPGGVWVRVAGVYRMLQELRENVAGLAEVTENGYARRVQDFDDYDDAPACLTCDDEGWVVACIDDLCQGEQGCIHGDNVTCPDCGNPLGEVVP